MCPRKSEHQASASSSVTLGVDPKGPEQRPWDRTALRVGDPLSATQENLVLALVLVPMYFVNLKELFHLGLGLRWLERCPAHQTATVQSLSGHILRL